MTGIVAAVASVSSGLTFGAGLYRTLPSGAVDLSPIAVGNQSSEFAPVNATYEWQGYIKGISTGNINLGASCPYAEYFSINGGTDFPYTWGGGGDSTCSIWTGNTARSGYNSGNRTAFIANGSGSVVFPVVVNTYYLIRVQWTTSLPRAQSVVSGDVYRYFAISSFDFQINGVSAVSGQIFYNTQTNGF